MNSQEANFQQQVIDIVTAFRTAFPNLDIPAPEWLEHWLNKYSCDAILSAIHTLQNHHPNVKARFTQDSIGRAMSTLLRADAVRRAIAVACGTIPGGRS